MESYEIWKDVKGYEGRYQISNKGRVWSVKRQKYLSTHINRYGYEALTLLAKNGKTKYEQVHRLVAIAFIPNPDGLPQVNHINEDKTNNTVDNLEWCSNKYNTNYGTRNKRISEAHGKKINQYDLEHHLLGTWVSLHAAAEALGIPQPNITKCCQGERKTAGGYCWEYA